MFGLRLLTVCVTLLASSALAAVAPIPRSPFRQATREDIVARRNQPARRLAPSPTVYATCDASGTAGVGTVYANFYAGQANFAGSPGVRAVTFAGTTQSECIRGGALRGLNVVYLLDPSECTGYPTYLQAVSNPGQPTAIGFQGGCAAVIGQSPAAPCCNFYAPTAAP